jgi:uncharacterized protein
MKSEFDAGRLDLQALAHARAVLEGAEPLVRYARLAEEAQASVDALQVRWTAEGELRESVGRPDQVWLHLHAETVLPQTCQRCLGPVDTPVQVENSFRFVADEAQAEAEDDEAEEDVLVLARDFDLHALIEDELLMALPLVPRHAQCPTEVPLAVQDEDFDGGDPTQANPFAVLAQLKKGGTG